MLATYFDDPHILETWLEPYRTASAADLARVAKDFLTPANRTTSLFLPEVAA
jgi:hypothetical protein